MIKKLIFSIILLVFSLFSFSNSAFASNVLFQDDFSQDPIGGLASKWTVLIGNPNYWQVQETNGIRYYQINIIGEGMHGLSSAGDNLWSNYTIQTNVYMEQGVDLGIGFRFNGQANKYALNIRFPGANDAPDLRLWKIINNTNNLLLDIPYSLNLNQWYRVKISINDYNIKIWVNDVLAIDYNDLNPDEILKKGSINIEGFAGGGNIVKGRFSNVLVTDNTSPPASKFPIVFLPGFGGSWNLGVMTANNTVGSWKKTPFVKIYDNLKASLISPAGGYQEGTDYFEYYYDWRKRINIPGSDNDLVYDLKNYIDNTVLNGKPLDTKVNLIGHSMGGLLSRAYAQEYGNSKINKIITVGTPHEGVINAYNIWEGGEISDKLNWSSVVLQLLLQSNKNNFQTNVDAIRSLSPSIQDLLPIFDYLKNNDNNSIISFGSMNQKNDWLVSQKASLTAELKNLLTTIYGIENNPSEDTIEWLKVISPTWLDNIQGKWQDGKPSDKIYSPSGDLTVLKKSAELANTDIQEVSGDHGQIISNEAGIRKILDSLGLNNVNPITETFNPVRNPSLIFFLHSPANLKVIAPDGEAGEGVVNPLAKAIYSPEDKLLIIPEAQDGNYQIQILGTGNGEYKLDIGQLTSSQDYWNTIQGTISSGATNTYTINFNANSPQDLPLQDTTGRSFLIMAKNRLQNLKIYLEANVSSFLTKKRLQHDIDSSIKNIDKAITFIDRNNFFSGSKQTQTALADVLDIRSKINSFYNKNYLTDSTYIYTQNELIQTADLLTKAWINLYKSSNKLMGLSVVKNSQRAALRSKNSAKEKIIAKIKGQEKNVGAIYSLAEQYYIKGEEYLKNNQLNEAYIYFFLSRSLSNEVLQYLK